MNPRQSKPINNIKDIEDIVARGHFGYYSMREIFEMEAEEQRKRDDRKELIFYGVIIVIGILMILPIFCL